MWTVLTVQYFPSGKHKNYDHVLTSILQILGTFQPIFRLIIFHVTMQNIYMLSGGNQMYKIKLQVMEYLISYYM